MFSVVVQGDLVIDKLLNRPVCGDLDLVVRVDKPVFSRLLFSTHAQLRHQLHGVTLLDNKLLEMSIDKKKVDNILTSFNMCNYVSNVPAVIFSAYLEEGYDIESDENLKFKSLEVKNSISIINNYMILQRFYLEIEISGGTIYKKKGEFSISSSMFARYQFLDLCFVCSNGDEIVMGVNLFNNFAPVLTFDHNYLIVEQIHSLFTNLLQNNVAKVAKRRDRILKLINKFGTKLTSDFRRRRIFEMLVEKSDRVTCYNLRYQFDQLGPIYSLKWLQYILKNDLLVKDPHNLTSFKISDHHVLDPASHYVKITSFLDSVIFTVSQWCFVARQSFVYCDQFLQNHYLQNRSKNKSKKTLSKCSRLFLKSLSSLID
ncbi:ORF20 [Plodia interpunctella granulovirus]|uniref:ORF20 n=1 Tax=Plodia interpunctella granulovirus TaxID=262175 RepID=A0A1L5JGI7_9BBAC|nr:ORF20 [Plodia interpunctella granulovirus]APO13904.1 ORF20 [Plodia interpunctella granulovirus]